MTTAPARHLVELGPTDLAARVDEALAVYVAAMGYPPSTARHRRTLWLDHVRRPGWRAVGWLDDAERLLGVAYGYSGAAGQWWYEEVARGLRRRPADRVWLEDYFELTELHVRPDAQGGGLGEALARRLLAAPEAGNVLLSTPEASDPNRAWSLYRRLGFVDVLRHHRFTSDPRPFAVLGRTLPLDGPELLTPDAPGRG